MTVGHHLGPIFRPLSTLSQYMGGLPYLVLTPVPRATKVFRAYITAGLKGPWVPRAKGTKGSGIPRANGSQKGPWAPSAKGPNGSRVPKAQGSQRPMGPKGPPWDPMGIPQRAGDPRTTIYSNFIELQSNLYPFFTCLKSNISATALARTAFLGFRI